MIVSLPLPLPLCVSLYLQGYMVDMLWADEQGFINGVRHSLEVRGEQEATTTLSDDQAGGGGEVVLSSSFASTFSKL